MKKILSATLVSLMCLQAGASVVYTQPHNGSASLYQSAVNGTDYDQLTWDMFRVTNSVAITEIRCRGGYLYGGAYSGAATNWTIAIYDDVANGYQPDIINPPLESYTLSGNGGEASAGNFGGTAMYDYTFTLPSPFQAVAGSNYWLLIKANQAGIPEWGIALGSGGNGKCFRRTAGVGDWWYYIANGDIAFTLLGSDGPTVAIAATPSPVDAGNIIGAGAYPVGSLATLTARASAGYGFVNWTEGGTEVSTAASYQFAANADRTLVANFAPRYAVTVAASPNFGGSVSGGGTFTSNSVVTVMALPAAGYEFSNWSEFGSPVSLSASYTFNATGPRTLVANFVAMPATETFDFDTGMPPLSAHQGLPGSQTKDGLTAYFSTLSGAWSVQNTFYGWVPGVFSGNFLYPSTWGSTLALDFSQPITNVSIAFFTGDVASEYDIPTKVRITAYTNAEMTAAVATATGQGDWLTGAYPEGTMSLGSATPFTRITIDMPSGQGLVSYLYWVDNIVAQQVVQPPAAITVNVVPAGGGTVIGDGTFAYGATVLLSAMANPGYAFTNWTEAGAEVCVWADYLFTATTNRTLTANFVTIPPTFAIVLAAQPSNGGTVGGGGSFANGDNVVVTATANSGYDFINWTENGTAVSSSTNYNFTVSTNRLLIANFAAAVVPLLEIQKLPGGVVLSWPTNSIGFTLEQNDALGTANWINVPDAVSVAGTNYQVSVSVTNSARFFRLQHP